MAHDEASPLSRIGAHVFLLGWMLTIASYGRQTGELWPYVALGSSAFFVVLNLFTPVLTIAFWGKENFAALETRKAGLQAHWCNLVVSLVHGVLASVTSYTAMIKHFDVATSWADVRLYHAAPGGDEWARFTGGLTIGYLFVDMWDAIRTGQVVSKWQTMAHHIMMATGLGFVVVNRWGEVFIMYGVICELNSAFLHLRGLMSMMGYRLDSKAYSIVWVWIVVTFATTRYLAHTYVVFRTWHDEALWLAAGIPNSVRYANLVAFIGLLAFNLGLHFQLISVYKRDRKWTAEEAHATKNAPQDATKDAAKATSKEEVDGGVRRRTARPAGLGNEFEGENVTWHMTHPSAEDPTPRAESPKRAGGRGGD